MSENRNKAAAGTVVEGRRKMARLYAIARPSLFWTPTVEQYLQTASEADILAMQARHTQRSIAFFRSQGFRRVGGSKYFAWCPWEDHPSRLLEQSDDYDP
jgi:hypothetical protein